MFVFKTIVWGTIFSFLALIAGPWFAVHFDKSFPQIDLGLFKYLGVLMMISGMVFSIYCTAIIFLPGNKRPIPYDSGHEFIIEGPYKYVRNPFLLGIIMTLIGETILLSRISMFAYTFLLIWCLHFWIVFFEEPALTERFGDGYRTYTKSTRRWIPRFKGFNQKDSS